MVHTLIKKIGVFRKSDTSMIQAFEDHIFQLEETGSVFHASYARSEIEQPDGIKYIFRVIANYEDVLKVSGINFHAVFSDVDCVKSQRFLLSRLRGS